MRIRINKTFAILTYSFTVALSGSSFGNQDGEGIFVESAERAALQVKQACPEIWEDLGTPIDYELNADGEAIWGLDDNTELDKQDYSRFLEQLIAADSTAPSDTNEQAVYSNVERIAIHCTTARTALLSLYYSNLPQSVVASMPTLNYDPGPIMDGFLVGDIRHTARREAADGWLFLQGQTIGPIGSTAILKGEEYRALFEEIKYWHPNEGENEAWDDNDVVQLPNFSGRTLVVGNSNNLGTTFGRNTMTLTESELPRHTHNARNAGNHSHTLVPNSHSHTLRTSQFVGSSISNYSGWLYFGQGRPRPEYHNNFAEGGSIVPKTHTHTVNNNGVHNHVIDPKGLGRSFALQQPSIRVNVEMKYK